MIETVYSNENGEYITGEPLIPLFKFPKNIRQVGQIDQNRKIYVEDYVMTYIKRLALKSYGNYQIAVLLGKFIRQQDSKNIFISGAVEVQRIFFEEDILFTNEAWTSIYESIKEHFTNTEIIGWYLTKPELSLEVTEQITKIHIDNFAGQDKILLMYDPITREEVFYIYGNTGLERQEGYYIYYEKNEEMQNYMIGEKEEKTTDIEFEDIAAKKIREVLNEKKPVPEQKKVVHILYGASTLLSVVILVTAATILNNYGKMKDMEQTLNVISDNITDTDKEKQSKQNLKTEVQTMTGNIPNTKEQKATQPPKVEEEKIQKQEEEVPKKQIEETKQVKDLEETEYYIVKKGDSIASICMARYHSLDNIEQIKELNNISDNNIILIGQKLLVPK